MARALSIRVTYGDAILSRFAHVTIPASLKSDLGTFKAQHAAFVKAAGAVDKAEDAYDAAAKKIAKLDAGRDQTVLAIADKLPGAGLGRRTSPFERFSKYAPTKLVGLSYAAETEELRSLVSAIAAVSPPAEIAKLCDKASHENDQVDHALKHLEAPLAALNEARSKRDAAIPDWEKHLRRLKDAAKVAFRDEPGRLKALFAEPDAIQTHLRPRRRGKKQEGGAAESVDGGAVKAAPKKRARRRNR